MRAFIISVDFTDLLRITLPYNRHHFDQVVVITSKSDASNVEPVARENKSEVFATDAFYQDGALFAKWRALEEGFDAGGRDGWIALVDPDVLWPKDTGDWERLRYNLYGPRRRMMENPITIRWMANRVLPEDMWSQLPLHPQQHEIAGFSMIFHGSDPHLGSPPWFDTSWKHCGGGDSFFQAKWPAANRVRPPWEVLHLGPAGQNWMGRATPYLDGTVPPNADEKRAAIARMWAERRGKVGDARFVGEKISPYLPKPS